MAKKLLFFFDGSSNRVAGPAGVVPTNMYHLNQAFTNGRPDSPQISFYFSGVGTRGDRFSAVTGKGFDEIIIDAYTNLASNYEPGDSIYLFGFSRGAAAARVLSAMISYPGLLRDTDLSLKFKFVWQLFTKRHSLNYRQNKRERLEGLTRGSMQEKPMVNFVGAFDTVPGSNWDKDKRFIKLRIGDLALEPCVLTAVQILAADDNRLPSFEPLFWCKGEDVKGNVEQIWMPGVHGDVGGHSDGRFIGNIALLTMIERVRYYCKELELDEAAIRRISESTFHQNALVQITKERDGFFMHLLPRGTRSPGDHPGTQAHELLVALHEKTFRIRGRRCVYRADRFIGTIPIYKTSFSDKIRQKIENMH